MENQSENQKEHEKENEMKTKPMYGDYGVHPIILRLETPFLELTNPNQSGVDD